MASYDLGTMMTIHEMKADLYLALGDFDRARAENASRLDPARRCGDRGQEAAAFPSLGDLALARGDTAKAREWTDQCLEIATRTNARKNLVKGWRLRGEIAMTGRQWDAEAALREALTIAQVIGNPTQIWKTHVAIGRLNAATEGANAAWQGYQKAREVIDHIRGGLRDPELRESLERAAPIRQVYDPSAPG